MQPATGTGHTGVPSPIETDALVIGAGPVGLFQVFQLGLLGIQCHVVDALPFPGGQCSQLYGDKPIYDIPAIPVCTGQELADRLTQQASVFAPHYHWQQQVHSLEPQPDGRLQLRTLSGTVLRARTVFITAGVGAFAPRTLKVEGLAALEGSQVFYQHPPVLSPSGTTLVVGGGDDAVQRALALADAGQRVVLSHRRDQFDAPEPVLESMRETVAQGRLALHIGLPATGRYDKDGHLTALCLTKADGQSLWVDCDRLEAYLGVSPTLAALKAWGINLDRKAVRIDPANGCTSLAGVFAAGDVCTYPGKKKLIVSGFHEACMAAYGAQAYLWPGREFPLQYTSSNSELHALLGVGS